MPLRINDDEDVLTNSIPSYYEMKKKERDKAQLEIIENLQMLFGKAVEFYHENYPKSLREIPLTWKNPKQTFSFGEKEKKVFFLDFLEGLSIEQKHLAREILFYSMKERNFKKLDTYYSFQELRGRIFKMIPGARYLKKIEQIEEQQQKVEQELAILYQKYNEEIEKAKKEESQKKETPKEQPNNGESYICECGEVCKSPAGLASHKRAKHPEKIKND